MANGGPPALQPPPVVPVMPPANLAYLMQPPVQQNQPFPHTQPGHPAKPVVKWLHFKSEFSGKPEEDAEAHLLRTNDLMETHNFPEAVKVQRFCLTFNR